MSVLLRAESIHKRFGGVIALDCVSLEVAAGEVHALIGENGAGKSTLGKIIAGVVPQDEGEIYFRGERVHIGHPLDAQRLGISIIFQELDLFPELTVAENIAIGNLHVESGQRVDFQQLDSYCRTLLDQVELHCPSSTVLNNLAIGQMQKVAIARALSMESALIVMDEPTSALPDEAVDVLFNLIRKLKDSGVAIIFVSHKMKEIFEVADRITVLRDGGYVGTRKAEETDKGELIKMMVGRDISHIAEAPSHLTDEVILSADRLTTDFLRDITFELHRGEVLGIAGLVGAGRSEIGAALFGLDPLKSGTITLHGNPLKISDPQTAIHRGIGLLPEDRKLQGLMMEMSVKENASISILPGLNTGGFIREREELNRVNMVHNRIALKAASPEITVNTLSGGNQQKVLLSRWLLVDPEVYFLDDPTRGIDVGAKEDIYQIIEQLAAEGKGVIFVSSELPELLRCCDRIMVLHEGESMGVYHREETTQEKIMALATRSMES